MYDPRELEIDINYFCKKLRITRAAYDELLAAPTHHYTEFPTWEGRYRLLKKVQALVEKLLAKKIKVYS